MKNKIRIVKKKYNPFSNGCVYTIQLKKRRKNQFWWNPTKHWVNAWFYSLSDKICDDTFYTLKEAKENIVLYDNEYNINKDIIPIVEEIYEVVHGQLKIKKIRKIK